MGWKKLSCYSGLAFMLSACSNGTTPSSSADTASISISNPSRTDVTQAGGSVTLTAVLSESVAEGQQIMLTGNPEDNITITSNPSPCVLESANSSCTFSITTSATESLTSLGPKTFIVSNIGQVLLSESTVSVNVVSPYMAYFAANGNSGYNGDLLGQANARAGATVATTGIQGADYLCNNDESKPSSPVGAVYKAMISDPGVRQACNVPNCLPESEAQQEDWVLYPTAAYQNINNEVSMVTNNMGVFIFSPNGDGTDLQSTLAPIIFLPEGYSTSHAFAFPWLGTSWIWTSYPGETWCGNGSGHWNSSSAEMADAGQQLSSEVQAPFLNFTQIAVGNRSCAESASSDISNRYIQGLICVQQ